VSESEPRGGLGFSDLFDLLRMGLTLTSIDDGRVRRANEFACQLLGRDAREVVGRDWHELVDPMRACHDDCVSRRWTRIDLP
jgi:PAS domain-containing protein